MVGKQIPRQTDSSFSFRTCAPAATDSSSAEPKTAQPIMNKSLEMLLSIFLGFVQYAHRSKLEGCGFVRLKTSHGRKTKAQRHTRGGVWSPHADVAKSYTESSRPGQESLKTNRVDVLQKHVGLEETTLQVCLAV